MQLPGVTVEVHKLEAAPLVAYLCRELRVAEIIDAHVTWDRHRTEVSPGTAITALLVNLLVRREPLYRIEWFFRDMDVEALFGNGIEAGHFNDDRLARALDKFADADPWRIYHEIALGSPDACSLVLLSSVGHHLLFRPRQLRSRRLRGCAFSDHPRIQQGPASGPQAVSLWAGELRRSSLIR
ncbi:protein of unknown function [Kyrpidia spormannii]|uniref:DUF4277 domain-containing protein n=1 Tax=Kyrpidia spormannii TaxID=2055160 RepID=A0A6F9DZ04_9BACL|nr:protein of unknown function [Kyrpidia spormannii]